MPIDRNSTMFVPLQTFVFVIAAGLTVLTIADIVDGEASWSVWIAIICWPIVTLASATNLVLAWRARAATR